MLPAAEQRGAVPAFSDGQCQERAREAEAGREGGPHRGVERAASARSLGSLPIQIMPCNLVYQQPLKLCGYTPTAPSERSRPLIYSLVSTGAPRLGARAQPAHAVCSVGPPLLSPPHHRLSRPPCGACCCWVGGTGDVGGSTTLGGKGVHGDADAVAVHQHGKGMQCHGKGCRGMLRGGSSMLRGHHLMLRGLCVPGAPPRARPRSGRRRPGASSARRTRQSRLRGDAWV